MIYLFDDNDSQQMSNNYAINFIVELEKHTLFIKHIDSVKKIDSIELINKTAKLICIHDSFPTTDDKAKIVAKALRDTIPLVIFSGGVDFTITKFENENYIKAIKKDRFYHNLINFLEQYKLDNVINLQKLAYGENYEIERINIIKDRLAKSLFCSSFNFNYLHFFDTQEQNFKDLWKLFYFAFNDSAEDEMTLFEEKSEKETVKYIYAEINLIIKKAILNYGK